MEVVAGQARGPRGGGGGHPLLLRPARQRVVALWVVVVVLAPLPLALPAAGGVARILLAFVTGFVVIGLYDAHVAATRGFPAPPLGGFLFSLFNVTLLVPRRARHEPVVDRRENRKRAALGLAQTALGYGLLEGLWVTSWSSRPFVVEHVVKAIGFFVAVVGMFQVVAAVARSLGATAREPCRQPYGAVTPADFWRRYNRVVGQFLYEDVFKRFGAARSPVLATLAAFLASGLLHEYVFSIAAGEVLGYQLGFFALQGVAVALTLGSRPTGARAVVGWAATLLFNLASSLLFFASLDHVVPFYTNPLPWGL